MLASNKLMKNIHSFKHDKPATYVNMLASVYWR